MIVFLNKTWSILELYDQLWANFPDFINDTWVILVQTLKLRFKFLHVVEYYTYIVATDTQYGMCGILQPLQVFQWLKPFMNTLNRVRISSFFPFFPRYRRSSTSKHLLRCKPVSRIIRDLSILQLFLKKILNTMLRFLNPLDIIQC